VSIPLNTQSVTLFDEVGEEYKQPESIFRLNDAKMSLSIMFPSSFSNICGWFWKITNSFFGTTGDKVWLVLHDETIYCYDSPYFMHKGTKVSYKCHEIENVVDLKESNYYQAPMIEIFFRSSMHVNSLILAWGDDTGTRKGLWKQALNKYCSIK
jgi:hypothetical protein